MPTATLAPAPGALELIQRFANSVLIDGRADRLRDVDAAQRWLQQNGDPTVPTPSEAERLRLVELRVVVRALLQANYAAAAAPADLERFNTIAADARLVVQVVPEGGVVLLPEGDGIARMVGRIIATTYAAMTDGTWRRLKLCASGTCDVAFYDGSKNRSATWCSMAGCGNREKVRAYQRRKAQSTNTS